MLMMVADKKDVSKYKDGLNKLTGKELNSLLDNTRLEKNRGDNYFVDIDLCIRSIYTNKVYTFGNHLSLHSFVGEYIGAVKYWLLLANVKNLLCKNFNINNKYIYKTALQPIGIIKEKHNISILFHLIIEDNFFNKIGYKKEKGNPYSVKDISTLNFTKLNQRDTIILPTLKIINKENV